MSVCQTPSVGQSVRTARGGQSLHISIDSLRAAEEHLSVDQIARNAIQASSSDALLQLAHLVLERNRSGHGICGHSRDFSETRQDPTIAHIFAIGEIGDEQRLYHS